MKAPKYVLVAQGSINRPDLTIHIRSISIDYAKYDAKVAASAIAAAGYSRFNLYNVESGYDKIVCKFSVETKVEVFENE